MLVTAPDVKTAVAVAGSVPDTVTAGAVVP